MPTPPCSEIPALLPLIQAEIALAASSAGRAESAGSQGEFCRAQHLYTEAERRLTSILGAICKLTDSEAGAIEPAFSEVENRLARLRGFFFHLEHCRHHVRSIS
jgi:hypothetical protein